VIFSGDHVSNFMYSQMTFILSSNLRKEKICLLWGVPNSSLQYSLSENNTVCPFKLINLGQAPIRLCLQFWVLSRGLSRTTKCSRNGLSFVIGKICSVEGILLNLTSKTRSNGSVMPTKDSIIMERITNTEQNW